MLQYPDIVVAASGDGEIELSGREIEGSGGALLIADYSPFAIAEFRDWLRGNGPVCPGAAVRGRGLRVRVAIRERRVDRDAERGLQLELRHLGAQVQ